MRLLAGNAFRSFRSSALFRMAVRPNGTGVFLLQTTIRRSKTFSFKRLHVGCPLARASASDLNPVARFQFVPYQRLSSYGTTPEVTILFVECVAGKAICALSKAELR